MTKVKFGFLILFIIESVETVLGNFFPDSRVEDHQKGGIVPLHFKNIGPLLHTSL